jgi:hypothetical protein
MTVQVTPPTGLKRQYPHVDTITDWRAQQSIRLLWDRVFALEERLRASEQTAEDLVATANAQEDRLAAVQLLAGEALALSQRTAGEAAGEEDSNEFGKIGMGSAPPTVSLNDDLAGVVEGYIADHPTEFANCCVKYGGGSWAFMDGLVAALQAVDERAGFNGKRGDVNDPSGDAIAYYHGALPPDSGSNDVYVVDIIACYCGPEEAAPCTPGPAWNDVTTGAAKGAWLATR